MKKIQNSGMCGAIGTKTYWVANIAVATDLEGDGEINAQRRIHEMVEKHNASDSPFKLKELLVDRWAIGSKTMIVHTMFIRALEEFRTAPTEVNAQRLHNVSKAVRDYHKPHVAVIGGAPIGHSTLTSMLRRNS